jgi:UTP--glucose-1-phosphate uridylyltransferase
MNTPGYVAAVLANAQAGGIHGAELAALRSRLRQLADPQAGLLPGEVLQPVTDLPRLDELPEPPPGQARDLLDQLAVIKLNGGLGTSMGLSGPKSLLPVKPGMNFLDIIARQVLALRERHRARLPLVLMNSAATRGPSLEVLGGYRGLREPVPLENRIRVVTCGSSGYQAARAYSLIRPPRTGFRRIRPRSGSATVRRPPSCLRSGTRWAMPWCGRAAL